MFYCDEDLFESFLNGETAINCETKEEHNQFFDFMRTKKVDFLEQNPSEDTLDFAKERIWLVFKKRTCYCFSKTYGAIQYSKIDYYISTEKDVVKFKDKFKQEKQIFGNLKMLCCDPQKLKIFIHGDEIAINCETKEEHNLFFDFMRTKKVDFLVQDPSEDTLDFIKKELWEKNKEKSCYCISKIHGKGMQYSDIDYYKKEKNVQIIKFKDFFKEKEKIKIIYLGI